jgi:hypothetical protein
LKAVHHTADDFWIGERFTWNPPFGQRGGGINVAYGSGMRYCAKAAISVC